MPAKRAGTIVQEVALAVGSWRRFGAGSAAASVRHCPRYFHNYDHLGTGDGKQDPRLSAGLSE